MSTETGEVVRVFDLEAVRARAAAATRGPWRWAGNIDHDNPRLVGKGGDVLSHIPRERTADDRATKEYANYLREQDVHDPNLNDGKGDWRALTEEEIAERVESEWLTDRWGGPANDEHLAFYGPPGPLYHDARELAIFQVCPDATDREDPRVYRADIIGLRNANAVFIAAARQDVDDLVDALDAARAELAATAADLARARCGAR